MGGSWSIGELLPPHQFDRLAGTRVGDRANEVMILSVLNQGALCVATNTVTSSVTEAPERKASIAAMIAVTVSGLELCC